MILHVTDAKYLEDYRIEVSFNDGKKGIPGRLALVEPGQFGGKGKSVSSLFPSSAERVASQ